MLSLACTVLTAADNINFSSTFIGALAQAFTSDRLGRKPSILIWSGIFTIGTVIQTATVNSIVQITVGRFVAGLGVGALSGALQRLKATVAPADGFC